MWINLFSIEYNYWLFLATVEVVYLLESMCTFFLVQYRIPIVYIAEIEEVYHLDSMFYIFAMTKKQIINYLSSVMVGVVYHPQRMVIRV